MLQAPIYGVNWNQMSDRKYPHVQKANASGSNPGGNSTRRTRTRLRPGALSPGGVGVDIKHNSYERYLNRLKGKTDMFKQRPPQSLSSRKILKTDLNVGCECDSTKRVFTNGNLECGIKHIIYQDGGMCTSRRTLCPPKNYPPKNQVYGYTESDSFLLQCAQNVQCGDIIPIL